MKTSLLAALAAMYLAGCASSGIDVDHEQLKTFQVGKTTRSEIEARLGHPNVITTSSDGTTVLIYQHANVRVRGESFIPIVGAFVGGSDTSINLVTINLDKDGLFKSTSSTTSEQGTSMGGSSAYRAP